MPDNLPSANNNNGGKNLPSFTASLYKGVIPPPEMMEHYARIDSSFPSRLLAMAEKEGEGRRKLEKSALNKSFWLDIVGIIAGLFAIVAVAFLAYLFLQKGYATDGRWIAVSVMIGLAAVFVTRKFIK